VLGDFVYVEGEDADLQQTVVKLLCEKGLTVATAESCTGGLVAKKLTEVAGASECFHCGVVTYSNDQKEQLLGVRHETLKSYGAVSEETALEMSKGVRERAQSDIGIGITGIAGPGGGSEEKPVGLVYVSICAEGVHKAYRLNLGGSRDMVRERASLYALDMIRRSVLGILGADYIW
jgi:nicotinamide-nucleotide amidase